jgi:L-methionine (R)-S-oxide reductase
VGDEKGPFAQLLSGVKTIVDGQGRRDDKLMAICQFLQDGVAHYDWVGFYLVGGGKQDLPLGPYVGETTQHVKIPFGRGICGQAAERGETFVVPDVSAQTNYLSCSPRVKSEIVVPIFKDGEMLGQLDIDSHRLNAFTGEDKAFLEDVCEGVAGLF